MKRLHCTTTTAMLALTTLTLGAGAAQAAAPTVIFQRAGVKTGLNTNIFSADGTALLLALSTGFEVRRATDGALLNTVNLPAGSLGYDAVAFSPDKTQIALVFFQSGTGRIELWRVSNTTLIRTITTDATRSFKAIDFSSGGLVATQERFAYGGGGFLRVHNASTGALVRKIGPTVRNSSPVEIGFSPNGQYLAGINHNATPSLQVYRTSDWTIPLAFGSTGLFSWSPDGGSLWTAGFQQVSVPAGTVLQTVTLPADSYITSITPNNHSGLATVYVNGQVANLLRFIHLPDGATQLTYTLAPGTQVWSGEVNSTATRFTYEICPTDCTVYVASMPAL